ncbi:IS5 family transposase [Escherichia coli]|uniref:IS5 family transposase n=1 Tax=Escherichia coli TaxID=562 RepID=UPI003D2FC246
MWIDGGIARRVARSPARARARARWIARWRAGGAGSGRASARGGAPRGGRSAWRCRRRPGYRRPGRQLCTIVERWVGGAGVMMAQGTLVDATIIEAPSSTKNKEQQRDPEMHQTKKGNQWHFGMKAHIGVDAKSGLTHSLVTTAANEHDLNQLGNLLHGEEQFVSADAGYQGAPQREELAEVDVDWLIAERPGKVRTLKQHPRKNKTAINIEYMKASIRARVEHPFRIIKRQFGFVKARYKGLLKNDNQLAMLFTLANLFRADQMIRQWERSH